MEEVKEYKEIRDQVNALSKKMDVLDTKINNIHTAIVGEEKFGYLGLVKMVDKHEKWITSQKFRLAYVSGGVGVLWTLLLKFWDKVF